MKSTTLKIQRFEELEQELDKHHEAELKLRLLFLRFLHHNFEDLEYACDSFKIALTTAYGWIHKWNEGGIDLLKSHPITGRHTKIK
ncbi:MAG: helix-turn-helix domain-containing protein [Acidobacteriota bacterium]